MKDMLIFVDTGNNNNKFYSLELVGNEVHTKWGRVGNENAQSKISSGGEKEYNKILNSKLKKGYVKTSINLDVEEELVNSSSNLLDIVMEQVQSDEESKELLKRLVDRNIHNITSNTKIKYDIKSGYFKTPLGIVTEEGVTKAMSLLLDIQKLIENKTFDNTGKSEFISKNELYFIQIPTKISTLRDFNNLLTTTEKVTAQSDICQALLDSIRIIETEKANQKAIVDGSKPIREKIFDISIHLLKDKNEWKRINDYFEGSKNKQHGGHANSYFLQNIYHIKLEKEHKEYRSDLNNQMMLFHGTKVANLLSILKSGLLMPKYSPGQATGYLYGQGLYFSKISTKSLNYCDGMYWNNASKQDKIYMFIADIAMGNYEVPKGGRNSKPGNGFDSYWAKGGQSGVINDEMIVFENNQIKLRYILEITL